MNICKKFEILREYAKMSNYWDKAICNKFPGTAVSNQNEVDFQNYWRQNNCSWELTKELLVQKLIIFEKILKKKCTKMSEFYIDYFIFVLKYINKHIHDSSFSNTSLLEALIYELFENIDRF